MLLVMMNEKTGCEQASFDEREMSWFLKGEPKRRAILPQEPPAYVAGVDDSIADHWFR